MFDQSNPEVIRLTKIMLCFIAVYLLFDGMSIIYSSAIKAAGDTFFAMLAGMTMAFLTLSMIEIFHSFNMRSLDKSLFSLKGHNKYLYWSLIGSFIATVLVLYVPFLRNAFSFQHISIFEFAVALVLAFMIIPVVEVQKIFKRMGEKKRN